MRTNCLRLALLGSVLVSLLLGSGPVSVQAAQSREEAVQSTGSMAERIKLVVDFYRGVDSEITGTQRWAKKSNWGKANLVEFYEVYPRFKVFEKRPEWTQGEKDTLFYGLQFIHAYEGATGQALVSMVEIQEDAALQLVFGSGRMARAITSVGSGAVGSARGTAARAAARSVAPPVVARAAAGGVGVAGQPGAVTHATRKILFGLITVTVKKVKYRSSVLGDLVIDMERAFKNTGFWRQSLEHQRTAVAYFIQAAEALANDSSLGKYINKKNLTEVIQSSFFSHTINNPLTPAGKAAGQAHKAAIEAAEDAVRATGDWDELVKVANHELSHAISPLSRMFTVGKNWRLHEGFTEFWSRRALQNTTAGIKSATGRYDGETAVVNALYEALVRGYRKGGVSNPESLALDALAGIHTNNNPRAAFDEIFKNALAGPSPIGFSLFDNIAAATEQQRYSEVIYAINTYWFR